MFYRGQVQRRKLLKSRSFVKKKKDPLNQPEWDSTIQDLTVHAASAEEVLHRQLRHKSKNADAARRHLTAKRKGLPDDLVISPAKVELEMKKLAILREVLYDHNDLDEVLRRTDNTMASVKTLFHDSTFRKSGRPNVTLAPGCKRPPVETIPDQPSKLDALSDSVMDNRALNDEASSEESEYEDDVQFESKVDYERFMNLLKYSMDNTRNNIDIDVPKTPEQDLSARPKMQLALNCTEEVKRTLSRISPIMQTDESTQESDKEEQRRKIDLVISGISKDASKLQKKLSNSTATNISLVQPRANITPCYMTYDDLQGAMVSVEKNIAAFEERTGRKTTGKDSSTGTGLTGFTATLVDAVTRLITYVNEGELKMRELETKVVDLKGKLDHQHAVSEALTLELVNTQKVIKQGQDQFTTLEEKIENGQHAEKIELMGKEISNLTRTVSELETKYVDDGSENHTVHSIPSVEVIEATTGSNMAIKEKDAEEMALKSDMVCLLGALKAQNNKVAFEGRGSPLPIPFPIALSNANTQEAAQTIASVESHLRHLKLQHAEAQQRMEELTKQAKTFSNISLTAEGLTQNSIPAFPNEAGDVSSQLSLPTKLPLLHRQTQQSIRQSNLALLPTAAWQPVRPFSTSPPCQDIPHSKHFQNSLTSDMKKVQKNDIFLETLFDIDGGSFQFLEQDSTDTEVNVSVSNNNVLISPHVEEQQKAVLNSIQRTQMSLEDRIAELNKQHNEAQGRLQKLVARRRNEQVGKKVQVSLPTADMFVTPNTRKEH